MSHTTSFPAVYKKLPDQEIDVDVYLPTQAEPSNAGLPVLIDIHGGAWMLGSSKMVNRDQVKDCLNRGWIVLAPNHRLCPQVDLFEGPMQDCRDLLAWVYHGGLVKAIAEKTAKQCQVDYDHVFAFGTSSGGTLSLALGFGVPRPVAGVFNMYGPCCFSDPFWAAEITPLAARMPQDLTDDFLRQVYDEKPVPIQGGVSLEGQAQGPPDFTDPRQAFALTRIAKGKVMEAVCPSGEHDKVDPILNISASFPPTFIVHGAADTMVPISLSSRLLSALQEAGVRCGMVEVPGEEHTFAAKMKVGSQTWELQRQGFDFLQSLIK
ncbi:unnamed protein product [Discula destructiva]